MATRIHGWEREATDSALARRFVRTLFEGDADGAADLVAENCVFHWTGRDDDTGGATTPLEAALQMVGSAERNLESIETVVSGSRIDASVTTSSQHSGTVAFDPEGGAGAGSESEISPFASVRVENDHIVEVWLHVGELGGSESRPLGTLVRRVSAWLHAY